MISTGTLRFGSPGCGSASPAIPAGAGECLPHSRCLSCCGFSSLCHDRHPNPLELLVFYRVGVTAGVLFYQHLVAPPPMISPASRVRFFRSTESSVSLFLRRPGSPFLLTQGEQVLNFSRIFGARWFCCHSSTLTGRPRRLDKTPPPPKLPAEMLTKTQARYQEALQRLTGRETGKKQIHVMQANASNSRG